MQSYYKPLVTIFLAFAFGTVVTTIWHQYSWKKSIAEINRTPLGKKTSFISGNFSADDIVQIRALLVTKTNEELLLLREDVGAENKSEIQAETGIQRGPLDGEGKSFVLKKENGQWKIIKQGTWVS